jgi:glycosyltransferase involved in cell wall biosynthesis
MVRRSALEGWFPLWRYWSLDSHKTAAQAAQARNARAAAGGVPALAFNKLIQAVFRFRSHFYLRYAGRNSQKPPRRRPISWRRFLTNIQDMDAVVTPWVWRLEPDLVHANDIYVLSAVMNARAIMRRRGRDVPMVYDAHEYVAAYPRGDRRFDAAYNRMEQELAPQFDAVVTVSEPIADAMWRDLKLPHRPVVVHNSPDLRQTAAPAGRSVRQAAGVAPGVPLMVYSGVIQDQRNVPGVIRALPLMPEVHFAVVCVPSTTVPLAQRLLDTARAVGVEDRVHLVEPVAPEAIAEYLSTADVGIDPMDTHFGQHAYALPNKLFDYLHAGLPVAVSTNEYERQFVETNQLGTVFDPDSPDQMAQAVLDAIAGADRFCQNAKASGVLAEYSWAGQVERLVTLYQELVPVSSTE